MDFLGSISKIIASVMATVSGITSSVLPSITPPQITPTPQSPIFIQENIISRSGEIFYAGQTIKYSINIPKNGGDITGSVNGICEDQIIGTFDGIEGGKIAGTASPNCGVAFIRKTFNVSYEGQLYLKQGRAVLNWTGDIPSTSGKGTYIFNFEPESDR